MDKLSKKAVLYKNLKWLKYNHIFRLIVLQLIQVDVLELRKISEEFNKLFKEYVKKKEIGFNYNIENEDLIIVKKYDMLKVKFSLKESKLTRTLICKNIEDKSLKYLSNCKEIDLFGCHKITDEGLKFLIENKSLQAPYLTNCRVINLLYCTRISNEIIILLEAEDINVKIPLHLNPIFYNNPIFYTP